MLVLNQTISQGNDFIEVDKVAFFEASKKYFPPKVLLKSRLLYDGGYYSLALDKLKNIEVDFFSSTISQMEYYYRLARIKSKLNYNNEIIIEYYNRVLMLKGNESYYYKPMSALQIAFIYEKENNLKMADFFFNKCLSMSGFDYEKSIHQKAKAGLERLY